VLSPFAVHLGDVIALGKVSVHVLALGVRAHVGNDDSADMLLLSGLCELSGRAMLRWEEWDAYGDGKLRPAVVGDGEALVETWRRVFGDAGPRGEDPGEPTLCFEITDAGNVELASERYHVYVARLERWWRAAGR